MIDVLKDLPDPVKYILIGAFLFSNVVSGGGSWFGTSYSAEEDLRKLRVEYYQVVREMANYAARCP